MPSQQYSAYNAEEEEGPGPVGYLALVLAWVVPGLGHMMVGQKGRGIVFMLTIHGLFAAGLLIGGIRSINPPDQAIWTYTQFLTGWPMLVANKVEKAYFVPDYLSPIPDPRDPSGRAATTIMRQRYVDEAHAQGVNLSDPKERKAFTEDFIRRNPLFAYHPKVQDMGAVYCGIAGMLNLLVMFDVLLRVTGSVREEPKKRGAAQHSTASEVAA